jgi:hypothetical protein
MKKMIVNCETGETILIDLPQADINQQLIDEAQIQKLTENPT